MDYKSFSRSELEKMLAEEQKKFKKLVKEGRSVDMTRGRPSKAQLEIAMPMLAGAAAYDYSSEDVDARNYGALAGTKACRALFAELFGVKPSEVIAADGSSLDLMYTLVHFAVQFGVLGSTPWGKLKRVKFICPAPGYDRHFAVTQQFGIEMITVAMKEDGPDMDVIEALVREDDSIKGIWCVPKYSNPTGITFSDKVVERMALMKTAAPDFRIFWDNAYMVHSLYDTDDQLKNIFDVARKAGTMDRIYSFASTSKITFAGSGVSAIAASEANIKDILRLMAFKCICPNKINQVMHTNFLVNAAGVRRVMAQHAALLRPKFHLRGCPQVRKAYRRDRGKGGRQVHRSRRHLPLQAGRHGQQHPHRALRAHPRGDGVRGGCAHLRRQAGAHGTHSRKSRLNKTVT